MGKYELDAKTKLIVELWDQNLSTAKQKHQFFQAKADNETDDCI